jgi:CHASE3 domain sensor protein
VPCIEPAKSRLPSLAASARISHSAAAMQPRQSISQLVGRVGDWLARSPRLVASVLVLAMIVLSLLIARNGQAQNEARNIAHSEGDTLLAILQLRMTLLDLETGQRGYILTQNPAYLEPYSAARKRVDPEYDAVRRELLSSATAADQAQLRQFGDLLRSKLAELDHTVALARAGEFAPAGTIVRANLGKRDMDAMRLQLAILSRNQAARRTESFDHARQVGGNLVPLILLLWFAAMLFGWAALVGERRRAATQARAEQAEELRAAHDRAKQGGHTCRKSRQYHGADSCADAGAQRGARSQRSGGRSTRTR